jgi:DisA bacterial checkpoint controller nucleotide-binding
VGQSSWDAEGKSFFMQRTGKASAGLGESIERALKAEGLTDDAKLPWSNIERLFSSEPIRKRAGISFSGGELTCLTDKKRNLETLQRIAVDLSRKDGRRIVLNDLWNNAKKGQYLDQLKSEGVFIDAVAAAPVASVAGASPPSGSVPLQFQPRRRTPKDKYLISSADQNPFMAYPALERAQNIWRELQFTLQFEQHDNAIAVLMRVLLELSIIHYAREHGLVFGASDYFAKRVSAVADSMLNRGLLDKKGREIVRKFESDRSVLIGRDVLICGTPHNELFLAGPDHVFKWGHKKWSRVSGQSIALLLERFTDAKTAKNLTDVVVAMSQAKLGALFVLANNADPILNGAKSGVSRIFEQGLLFNINDVDKWSLVRFASTDGATVILSSGQVIESGAILAIPESLSISGEGARTMAAIFASKHGIAIKVSDDGPVSIYVDGSLVRIA